MIKQTVSSLCSQKKCLNVQYLTHFKSSNITKMTFRDEGIFKTKCPWNFDYKYFDYEEKCFFDFVQKCSIFVADIFSLKKSIYLSWIFFQTISIFSDFQKCLFFSNIFFQTFSRFFRFSHFQHQKPKKIYCA